MTGNKKGMSLLEKYFNQGALDKKYYGMEGYLQPFSAEERLQAGTALYADFLKWNRGHYRVRDYATPRVDGGMPDAWQLDYGSERFRRALKKVSRAHLPVIYKIVLEEAEIKAPAGMGTREKLYFNDEIKGLLCRGLDELCTHYGKIL